MLIALLLAVAQQSSFIALDAPSGDDDFHAPRGVAFTPDGRAVVAQHLSGTMTLVPLAASAASASGVVGPGPVQMLTPSQTVVTPDGQRALHVNDADDTLSIVALPQVTETARVPLSLARPGGVLVDSTGTIAVVWDEGPSLRVAVVDLVAGVELRSFAVASPLVGYDLGGLVLGADDRTLFVPDVGSLGAYDIATGLETARVSIAGPLNSPSAMFVSTDRTRAVVITYGITPLGLDVGAVVVDLPSLTIQGTAPFGAVQGVDSARIAIDHAATLVVFASTAGCHVADLATGVTTLLMAGPVRDCTLSGDGTRALVLDERAARIFATSSGALVAELDVLARTIGAELTRAPSGHIAVVSGGGVDRLEVLGLVGPSPRVVRDVQSGFGEEGDGSFVVTLAGNGRHGVAIGRDSDDLRVIDLEQGMVTGRVDLDREPSDVTLRSDGLVAVVHARGQSLAMIDPAGPTVIARYALPGPAELVRFVPATTIAWVYLEGIGVRALTAIDTASGATLAYVPLAGEGNALSPLTSRRAPSVTFDFVRSRALVLSPSTASLEWVDLNAGLVVDSDTLGGVADRATALIADMGGYFYVLTSAGDLTGFIAHSGGLARIWTTSCPIAAFGPPSEPFLALFEGEQRLLAGFQGSLGTPGGSCTGPEYLNAGTGASIASVLSGVSVPSNALLAEGDELILVYGPLGFARQYRRNGAAFVGVRDVPVLIGDNGQLVRDPQSGRTLIAGATLAGEGITTLDLLDGDTSRLCAPATPNATGAPAVLTVDGAGMAGAQLFATVTGLQPGGMFGYLNAGSAATAPTPVAGSIGALCLGGSLARFALQVQTADLAGAQHFVVDTGRIPTAGGPTAALPGTTWTFQSWYRDSLPAGPTSNFSDALSVTLR